MIKQIGFNLLTLFWGLYNIICQKTLVNTKISVYLSNVVPFSFSLNLKIHNICNTYYAYVL